MSPRLPPLGQTITLLSTGETDWLTQKLVGSGEYAEEGVLWWGYLNRRWQPTDLWVARYNQETVYHETSLRPWPPVVSPAHASPGR